MSRCDHDSLEALAFGELGDDLAAKVEAHASECPACQAELDWLRLELAAFEQRGIGDRSDEAEREALWDAIEARIEGADEPAAPAARPRRPLLYFGAGFAAASAAAAALVVWLQLSGSGGRVDTPVENEAPRADQRATLAATSDQKLAAALAALDKAESEYQEAITALEATYRARRDRLTPKTARGYDRAMADSRSALDSARKAAGDDVNARMQVLDAYSAHLNTLQTVATESDL